MKFLNKRLHKKGDLLPYFKNPFSAQYQAVLTEATAQGYTLPSVAQQAKQNTLMTTLISSGVFAKLDLILVMANDGSKEFSCINWKNPSGAKATLINSPTWASNEGFTGNGTSSYLLTGYNPDGTKNYKLNDACRYAYLKVNAANKVIDGVETNTTNSITTFPSTFQRINQSGFSILATIDYSGVGMKSIHRTSMTAVSCYNDNTATNTTATSTGLSGLEQAILRSASTYGTHQVSFYAMGASLISENSSLVSAFSTYLSSL